MHENKNPFGTRRFDQIWFNDLIHIKRDDDWYSWLSCLAPVRIGFLIESLDYSPEEMTFMDDLKTRKMHVKNRIKHMTHVVACDEIDAFEINQEPGRIRAMWSPFSVPKWAIQINNTESSSDKAVFMGSLYGNRKKWVEDPLLASALARAKSHEDSSIYPISFDVLRRSSVVWPGRTSDFVNDIYMRALIHIRKKNYTLYLRSLSSGRAIVNFPHFVKTYSPRVVEGIGTGRPVISWEIPDRPLNKSLFEDEREILLYSMDNVEQLHSQIQRVLKDGAFGRAVSLQALKKLNAFHTNEKRVEHILKWLECGEVPSYT